MAGNKRAIRIANCSGAIPDPGYQMLRQAESGQVDAITGDYLAEMNLGTNAKAYRSGKHPGWEPSAEDGLMQTLEICDQKRFKIIVNGGALNPSGLAKEVAAEIANKKLNLKVAYVSGDDVYDHVDKFLKPEYGLKHLDEQNPKVKPDKLLKDFPHQEIVSANAYLGARSTRAALDLGADIVICGRVSDASPVIALAAWWHNWNDTDFDRLAHSLVAGHLIECSAYSTGANFSDFERYDEDLLVDIGLPIAEIADDGTFVITKHDSLNGLVNVDVIKCQFLYELQGNIYLNSDVKADLTNVVMTQQAPNRVHVAGIKGHPPPPTTKLAIFYDGGYQNEMVYYATGTPRNVKAKWHLFKRQIQKAIDDRDIRDEIDVLDLQEYAAPETNPKSQTAGTSAFRVFAQAKQPHVLGALFLGMRDYFMQHYSGFHSSDYRTCIPKPFVAYYPAKVPQSEFKEKAHLIDKDGNVVKTSDVPTAAVTEPVADRDNYETANPVPLYKFGETVVEPVETVVVGRSGDKGGNANLGLFVHQDDEYEWLKAFFTRDSLKQLIGDDWSDDYFIERIEFPHIRAIHFVVYGILGRGTSSSSLVDSLGKGFCDYIRSKHIDIPKQFVDRYKGKVYSKSKI